jgi:hypothetical protein
VSPRTGSICDGALRTLGALASLGVLFAALHDTSLAWDGWYYHLPFAARLVGLIPADAYVFHPANQARYAGFALLAELLQGVLWRITGRAESANLVAFASVPLVAWFLQRRWQVPFTLTLLALFAVPLVQAHAPSTYVDLPGNAAASVLVLLLVHAYASESPPSARDVVLALLAGAIAANIKPLLQPIVGLGLLAMLARLVQSARDAPSRHRAKQLAALMVLAAPLVLFTPLKNAALHHNPFYPIGVDILGVHLPGPEAPYASSPPWLAAAPRPLRFVSSLLEIGVRPLSDPRRWTVDQWMPDDSMGNRMGGFFGAYVVLLLLALGYRVARDNTRLARVSGVTFGVFTVLVACMPQSHELRYYLSWMIVLVSLNLLLAARPGAPRFALGLRGLGTIAAGAFLVVLASTRGAYAYPGGLRVVDLVRARVDPTVIDGIAEGEHVCVRGEPFSLLWADRFHPPHHYVVQEAEALEDCRGLREVGAR